MDRTRTIEHRGRRILYHDFSYVLDADEALEAIEQAHGVMEGEAPSSVLSLVHVSGSRFDVRISRALQELAAANRPYVRAAAVVGVSGLQKVVLTAVSTFSKRHLQTFEDLEEAKNWLVEQE